MVVGNLELTKLVEITTSTSSVDITDCFNANYDVYKIVVNGISTAGTTQTDIDFRFLDSGGSVVTASNYDYAIMEMNSNTTISESRNTNQDKLIRLFAVNTDQEPETASGVAYIYNPFSSSSYSFVQSQSSSNYAALHRNTKAIGVLKQTATMSGFRLFESNTRPYDTGTIKVYGLASN